MSREQICSSKCYSKSAIIAFLVVQIATIRESERYNYNKQLNSTNLDQLLGYYRRFTVSFTQIQFPMCLSMTTKSSIW